MSPELSIWSTTSTRFNDLVDGIDSQFGESSGALMILLCSRNNYDCDQLSEYLNSSSRQIFGGIFPGLVSHHHVMDQGAIIISFPFELDIYIQKNLAVESIQSEQFLTEANKPIDEHDNLIIFIDGLCKHTEKFIHRLYEHIGSNINTVGGGAGHHDLRKTPNVFSNFGLFCDAALMVGLPFDYQHAVGQGWSILDGPFLATKTHGHDVFSINYETAFTVYKQVLEEKSGFIIDQENFNEIAPHYPIGIYNLHGELIVRDLIDVDEKKITCVGEINQNTMIHVLHGNPEELVESVKVAINQCKNRKPKTKYTMIFLCFSRLSNHSTEAQAEISAIANSLEKDEHAFGVLSLGEISNSENGSFTWLNKSITVANF